MPPRLPLYHGVFCVVVLTQCLTTAIPNIYSTAELQDFSPKDRWMWMKRNDVIPKYDPGLEWIGLDALGNMQKFFHKLRTNIDINNEDDDVPDGDEQLYGIENADMFNRPAVKNTRDLDARFEKFPDHEVVPFIGHSEKLADSKTKNFVSAWDLANYGRKYNIDPGYHMTGLGRRRRRRRSAQRT